jgi:Ca-activated chloride channel family protein
MARRAFSVMAAAALMLGVPGVGGLALAQRSEVHHHHILVPQVRRRPAPERPVFVSVVNARVSIVEQVATTELELTLRNDADRPQEAQILLPVPDGVAVRSLQYDGVGPEPVAKVLAREEARRIYESIVASMRDPALVEFAGFNLIRTSVFPVPARGEQKLRLTYEQVLTMDGQRVDYWLPRSESLGAGETRWSIQADIHAKKGVATVYSPSHDVDVQRRGAGRVSVRALSSGGGMDRGSFRLSYVVDEGGEAMSATVLAYPDPSVSARGGGYFLVLAGVGERGRASVDAKREVVLVLDRSGSMRGEKMAQAKAAALQIVEGLRDGEFFNIIDYSDSVSSFRERAVEKTEASAREAREYIGEIVANGGTNIHDALLEALRPEPAAPVAMVLFLTDGLPTIGERSEVKIREAVAKANAHDRRIFTFGVGFDVNSPLLSAVAKQSRGATTFVLPQEDVEVKVSQVYRRLSGPVLVRPKLMGGGTTRELMPAELPDVFEGDQLVVLGRYVGEEACDLRITGTAAGKDGGTREIRVRLDPGAATARNGFVARLWASSKIAMMLEEIREAGAEGGGAGVGEARMKELVDEVVRLSTRFGILTEYTAFLATEPVGGPPVGLSAAPGRALDEVSRKVAAVRSGSGAVNQESNLGKMKDARSPAQTAGATQWYFDDKMQRREATAMQNVADRTLFQRGNRWVDSRILDRENDAPDRVVEFASEAYNTLVQQLAAENRQGLLALGGEVYLEVGKERVLVKGP